MTIESMISCSSSSVSLATGEMGFGDVWLEDFGDSTSTTLLSKRFTSFMSSAFFSCVYRPVLIANKQQSADSCTRLHTHSRLNTQSIVQSASDFNISPFKTAKEINTTEVGPTFWNRLLSTLWLQLLCPPLPLLHKQQLKSHSI